MKRKLLIFPAAVILIVLVLLLSYYFNNNRKSTAPEAMETPQMETPVSTRTYKDDVYGYSFSYPDDWYLYQKNIYGTVSLRKTASKGVVNYNSLDGSLTPEQEGVIFVYPTTLTVNGEEVSKEKYIDSIMHPSYASSNLNEWSTLVWNGRDVLREKETLTGAVAYIGGSDNYYVFDGDKAYVFQLNMKRSDQVQYEKNRSSFTSLVKSVTFAPKEEFDSKTAEQLQPNTVTESWNLFQSEAHGFSFKYPDGWNLQFPGTRCDMRLTSPDAATHIDICWSKESRFRGRTLLQKI